MPGTQPTSGRGMGSVAQSDPSGVAVASAYQMLSAAPVGNYAVSVLGSGLPGDLLIVQVSYTVPNYFAGLAGFFGVDTAQEFSNAAMAYFRQEGW